MKFAAALLVFVVYLCQALAAPQYYPPQRTQVNVRRTLSGVPIPGVPVQQRIHVNVINRGPVPPQRTQINIRRQVGPSFPFGK